MRRLAAITCFIFVLGGSEQAFAGWSAPPRVGFNGGDITVACAESSWRDDATMKVRIMSQGQRGTAFADASSCWDTEWSPSIILGPRWNLTSSASAHSRHFRTDARNKTIKARIIATFQGQRRLDVSFRQRYVHRPQRRIWAYSDAFVNYCINEGVEIKSSGGRLYCLVPNSSYYSTSHVRFRVGGRFSW